MQRVGVAFKKGEIFHQNFVAQFREALRTCAGGMIALGIKGLEADNIALTMNSMTDIIAKELSELTDKLAKEMIADGEQKLAEEFKARIGEEVKKS